MTKLRHVHAGGDEAAYALPDEALQGFMEHCSNRIGQAYFQTPRNTIRAFVQLLTVLEQNPSTPWTKLVGAVNIGADSDSAVTGESGASAIDSTDDELVSFRL